MEVKNKGIGRGKEVGEEKGDDSGRLFLRCSVYSSGRDQPARGGR